MSTKNSTTKSDYLDWDSMVALVHRLYRDGDYKMSLLIGCGCFFGLRISDLKLLTWSQVMDADQFRIQETKTKKWRTIKINDNFQKHIKDCYTALHMRDRKQLCFQNRAGDHTLTTQYINRRLKMIRVRYHLKIEHFSTHSFRKTMGRHVVEMAGERSEMALIKLSELFGHSNVSITRIYLGLRQEELMETYDLLDF